jgi:hypothetical protein
MYLPSKDHNYPLQGEPEALGGSRNPQSYKNNCFKTAATALEAAVTKDSYCHDNCCECGDTCFCTKTAADPTTGCTEQTQEATSSSMGCTQKPRDGNGRFCFCDFCRMGYLLDPVYYNINKGENGGAATDKNQMTSAFMRYLDRYAKTEEYVYYSRYGETLTGHSIKILDYPKTISEPFKYDKLPGVSFFWQLHRHFCREYPATVKFEDGDERGIIREFLVNNAGVLAELVRSAAF